MIVSTAGQSLLLGTASGLPKTESTPKGTFIAARSCWQAALPVSWSWQYSRQCSVVSGTPQFWHRASDVTLRSAREAFSEDRLNLRRARIVQTTLSSSIRCWEMPGLSLTALSDFGPPASNSHALCCALRRSLGAAATAVASELLQFTARSAFRMITAMGSSRSNSSGLQGSVPSRR